MQGGFTRLFSLYNFFSVFLPGLVFIVCVAPLFPRNLPLNAFTAVVPLLAMGFVVGQALHSLAVGAQRLFGFESHRERFARTVCNAETDAEAGDSIRAEFVEAFESTELSMSLRETSPRDEPEGTESAPGLEPPELVRLGAGSRPLVESSTDDGQVLSRRAEEVYTLVQSYIHSDNRGRSRTYEAIYAFCRSGWLGSFLLWMVYWLSIGISVFWDFPFYEPWLATITANNHVVLYASAYLFVPSAFIFKYAADQYQRYFIQYLLTDFVVLRSDLLEESG